jgi:hypothetical protein
VYAIGKVNVGYTRMRVGWTCKSMQDIIVIHGLEMGEYATADRHDSECECEIRMNVSGWLSVADVDLYKECREQIL